ncbi:hypothetical protein ACMHYO_12000 [Allopusillimonas ginsengisoli]|uniref:hypothetical protein n=1 Tax=Allopusillimonas ginsengisoli TaxID=453575 RepID=UPI0039C3CD1A
MLELETACEVFLGASDEATKRKAINDIAVAFYTDPRILRILESRLSREHLHADRKDDLRHDAFIAFSESVLPKLKYPHRAIGAVSTTIQNCIKRMLASRLSVELKGTASIDNPDSGIELDSLLGSDRSHETRIVEDMMKQQAAAAIESAIKNQSQSAVQRQCWVRASFPTRPDLDGPRPKVPITKIPPAKKLVPHEPRYRDLNAPKDPTPEESWFVQAREQVGLTVNSLADILGVRPGTLRSYLDLRVSLPDTIYKRMRTYMKSAEAQARAKHNELTRNTPMVDIVKDWQARTGLDQNNELAAILGTTPMALRRWQRPKEDGTESRPHSEDLFTYEQRVQHFERAQKKKRGI